MKCPVCCEVFTGERCPHCGMRVSGSEERLFSGEQPRPASRQAARPMQKQPVRRSGKISLAALERRQEVDRKSRRLLLWVVGLFLVVMVASFLPLLLKENSFVPQPEPVAPASEIAYDSPYDHLETEMENWAAENGWDTLFFYMEEDDVMNGSLSLADVAALAESAAAGDEAALARWNEAADQCASFYQAAREKMDAVGRTKMPLNAWLSDEDSGELVLAMDEDGVWYSYYEELLAEQ